jgi:dephospho-CoA kinase
MKVVKISGGIGCGKSLAGDVLRSLGCAVIDADIISKELMRSGGEINDKILKAFGKDFFDGGVLNRKKLGEYVFEAPERLKTLTDITHPPICKKIKEKIAEHGGEKFIFVLMPPLKDFSTVADDALKFDYFWLIISDKATRINRVMLRDGLPPAEIKKRMLNQLDDAELIGRADTVIYNDGGKDDLIKAVKDIYNDLIIDKKTRR